MEKSRDRNILNPANRRWGRTGNFHPHLVPPNLQMERTTETAKQNGPAQKNIPKKHPEKKHATRANARKRRFERKTKTRSGTGAASSSGGGKREMEPGRTHQPGEEGGRPRRRIPRASGVGGPIPVSGFARGGRRLVWGRGGGGARSEGREETKVGSDQREREEVVRDREIDRN
jgi:hypothetical protein